MWEVANGKISDRLVTSWEFIKFLSSKATQGTICFVYILQRKINWAGYWNEI